MKVGWCLALVASAVAGPKAGGAEFHGLGELAGGRNCSVAVDVSHDGRVVVGTSLVEDAYPGRSASMGFRWDADGGMIPLGMLESGASSGWSRASAVSGNGTTVVGSSRGVHGEEAVRWTAGSGLVSLGELPGGSRFSSAAGVSYNGATVVGISNASSVEEPFRWTPDAGMVGFGHLENSQQARVVGVSDDGTLMAGWSSLPHTADTSWRLTNHGYQVLPKDSFFTVQAAGLSANGQHVVGYLTLDSPREVRAFRWDEQRGYAQLGQRTWSARDATNNGEWVVGARARSAYSLAEELAVIWNVELGLVDLQGLLMSDYGLRLDGWTLQAASSITPDGDTIVGWGLNPEGDVEAWRVTGLGLMVPEPHSMVLLLVSATVILGRPRRSAAAAKRRLSLRPTIS